MLEVSNQAPSRCFEPSFNWMNESIETLQLHQKQLEGVLTWRPVSGALA